MTKTSLYFHAFVYDGEKLTTAHMRDFVALFRARWRCAPASYWINTGGLVTAEQPHELTRHRTIPQHMVYLEIPAEALKNASQIIIN